MADKMRADILEFLRRNPTAEIPEGIRALVEGKTGEKLRRFHGSIAGEAATERMVSEDLAWASENPRAKIPLRFIENFANYDQSLKAMHPDWSADRRAEHIARAIGDAIGLSEADIEQTGKRWRKLARELIGD